MKSSFIQEHQTVSTKLKEKAHHYSADQLRVFRKRKAKLKKKINAYIEMMKAHSDQLTLKF